MGYLTTHVLDTTHGTPASQVSVTLYRLENGKKTPLVHTLTNQDGRCDQALLQDDNFKQGCYQLEFAIGDYFRASGLPLEEPLFLDEVVIRFGISDESSHYHVPVLVSPYGYSTYRGS
ncbi:hydroxyisourate hydrolase [Marinomonas pollencensis]|uniref:5-hydroxyisourate hydrolase n=1 Tax=Marinomonas pollencensis TaxID=491954 RepID=A0A3E0DN82_9GAMM|nr:hydroxyisourate hydrolase [Marinomonas pollencensis]REG83261.1 5-hydroxyisourate hydrolase [Marinomonas pollencensis]